MSFVLPKPKSVTADEVVLKRADWDEVVATLEDLLEDLEDIAAVAAGRAEDAVLKARLEAEWGVPVETKVPIEVVKATLDGIHPIRAWREYRGWTPSALSAKSGVAQAAIEELEARSKSGSTEVLTCLARAFGIPPDSLDEDDKE